MRKYYAENNTYWIEGRGLKSENVATSKTGDLVLHLVLCERRLLLLHGTMDFPF